MRTIALAALLSACGHASSPELLSIAAEFSADTGQEVYIPIYFGELPDGTAGVCRNKGEVIISHTTWRTLNSAAKRGLVYHELGHCILNLNHGEGRIMDPRTAWTFNEIEWHNMVTEMIERSRL